MRFLAPLLLWGCASPDSPPSEHAPSGADFAEWHIHLDAGGKTLGAYTLTVRFNPEVAVIESIRPCAVRHFRGNPEFDPASLTGGSTRVAALDTFPQDAPRGDYHLLTVTFRKVAAGMLAASVRIERLYDDANRPLAGRITAPGFEHTFR